MKPMRKTVILLLCAALSVFATVCIAGCGGNQASSTASSSASSSAEQGAGKTLVAYYSATGNTAAVAQQVAKLANAETFAIMPAQPYTQADLGYDNPDSRASREHDDPALRDVALAQAVPDEWESYDTIIIGYPIWWGEAAYPMMSFVKANDFTGKSVIPFCTSGSSGIGDSAQQLEKMSNGGEWLGGMRFPADVPEDEVRQWIDDLGLENQNLR